ncbi:MAG: hypothetical protein ACRYGK_16405 [Janthinobacterium lividum]
MAHPSAQKSSGSVSRKKSVPPSAGSSGLASSIPVSKPVMPASSQTLEQTKAEIRAEVIAGLKKERHKKFLASQRRYFEHREKETKALIRSYTAGLTKEDVMDIAVAIGIWTLDGQIGKSYK